MSNASGGEKLSRAGDVVLSDAFITSSNGAVLDISSAVVGVELYENIFETFVNGKAVVSDSSALQTFFPMVGNEFLTLRFHTPGFSSEDSCGGEFFIYKCSDSVRHTDRNSVYVLYFISKEAVVDQNKRISHTFRDSPSDAVKWLLGDNGLQTEKKLFCEEPRNRFAFCSNWWKPSRCIQWVADHGVSASGSPSFLFFENRRGFVFASLDSIMDSSIPVAMEFSVSNYSRTMGDRQTASRDLMKDYQTILQIDYHNGFDYFKRLRDGFYGSEIITMDMTTQRYTHNRFGREFFADKHLNAYSPVAEKVVATSRGSMKFVPRMYNNFEDFEESTVHDTVADRNAILSRLSSQGFTIQVYGRTDYSAGQKVRVTIPRSGQVRDGDSDSSDKLLSGVYLVTGLCHNITSYDHRTILELAKDSYSIDINKTGMPKG